MGAVPEIPGIIPPGNVTLYNQKQLAKLLNRDSIKFPGSQPVSFTRRHLHENLMEKFYFVCEKSDGIRCLMYLTVNEGAETIFLITRTDEYYYIQDLHFPGNEMDLNSFHTNTLIDGELVLSKTSSNSTELIYLMFDCMAVNGRSLVSNSLTSRLGHLHKDVVRPFNLFCKTYPDAARQFAFRVKVKEMEFSYGLEKVFYQTLPNLKHVSDGLIFTAREEPYISGTDVNLLKWKPPEENTVDFVWNLKFPLYTEEADQTDDESDGLSDANGISVSYIDYDSKPSFELLVWEGGSDNYRSFAEMYVTDEEWANLKSRNEPLNDRVVESYKDEEGRWRFHRFRDDKENANHLSVVKSVIESIDDHVTQQELIEACGKIKEQWKKREREGEDLKRRKSAMESTHPAKRLHQEQH